MRPLVAGAETDARHPSRNGHLPRIELHQSLQPSRELFPPRGNLLVQRRDNSRKRIQLRSDFLLN